MKRLFFRFDAAPEIGLGHLRRCAVLAKACRDLGAEVHALPRLKEVSSPHLADWADGPIHPLPWHLTPQEDAQAVQRYCAEKNIHLGVVDHYRIDSPYQQTLLGSNLRWMQFGNRVHAFPLHMHLLHDSTPDADPSWYAARLPSAGPTWLLGPRYALVHPSFSAHRPAQPRQLASYGSDCHVLISLGGGNDQGMSLRALSWLRAAGHQGEVTLLASSLNPHLAKIQDHARQMPRLHLVLDNWQPAALMAACDLAITAGGTTLHECATLGLPTLIVILAENQLPAAKAWPRLGLGENLGIASELNDSHATSQLQNWLQNPEKRHRAHQANHHLQDGQGPQRTAQALLDLAPASYA